MNPERRTLLKQIGTMASAVVLPIPFLSSGKNTEVNARESSALSFGVVADTHADLIPDNLERLEKFIESAIAKDVDFIVQLGDFCFPKKENLDFLNLWNEFKGPKYHLLGNHDMDVSSKQESMKFWDMPERFYSFDQKGIHFVVLDPNFLYVDGEYQDYSNANFYVDDKFRTFVDPSQLEWLVSDLHSTDLQTIILSHQSLINPAWGIKNRIEIQELLETENQRVGYQKVIACFNGHDHIDFQRTLNGIHYVEFNSMSYQWLGEKYSNKTRYSSEQYEQYQHLDKLGAYEDSLFAFVEINKPYGVMKIEGVQSDWLAPSPFELGMAEQPYGMRSSASISDRILKLK